MRNWYSRLLFTNEDYLCANLQVQGQTMNMTSQYQYPTSSLWITIFGHLWCNFPMIFTHENYWQIASLVTQKSLFMVTHALFYISCPWDKSNSTGSAGYQHKHELWQGCQHLGNTKFIDFTLTLKNKNFPWLFPDCWQPCLDVAPSNHQVTRHHFQQMAL